MEKKTGILLVNLGTPDAPTVPAVRKYLKQFLLDGRVIDYSWLPRNLLVRGIIAPFRAPSSAKLYQMLWTAEGSPLKLYGQEVAAALNHKLEGDVEVVLAMRYQNPSIASGLEYLQSQKVNNIVVFPMFPQYASATMGSIHAEVMRIVSQWQTIPQLNLIGPYYDNDDLCSIFADNAKEMDLKKYEHFIFSFHGIPQRQLLKADRNKHCLQSSDCCQKLCSENNMCYSAQCHATARVIADKLSLDSENYTVTFQSRLGPEKWTQPYTSKVLEHLNEKAIKKVLVFSPAFVADCLETTIEIAHEYREEFLERGGETLDLVPSLNANPRWISVIKDILSPYF